MDEREIKTSAFADEKEGLGLALFLSLLFHAGLIFILPDLFFEAKSPPPELKSAQVVFRDPVNKNPRRKEDPHKPVVALSKPNALRPKEAKYLAEYDHKTDKDRVAKKRENSLNNSDQPQKKGQPATEKPNPEPLKHDVEEKPTGPRLADDGYKVLGAKRPKQPKTSFLPDPLGLRVSPGNSEQDAMPFSDHLPHVAEADSTSLNAWQWRHAQFFNRLKSSIARTWSPNAQIARFDPRGVMLGQMDRVTVMLVTIDSLGKLTELSVANSSGVSYLDDEAMRAFQVAAPFPHPPRELFKNKDEFTFKFAFHLQINRGVKLDFDWSPGG